MKKLSLILIAIIAATTLTSCGNNSELDLLKGEINELKQIIEQKGDKILEQNQTIEQSENKAKELKQTIEQKKQEIEELNDSVTQLLGFRTINFNCPYYNCDSCISTCELLYGTRGYRPLGCACYKCKPKGGTFGDRLPDCNCYNCGNGYHKGLMQIGDYRFGMGDGSVAGRRDAILIPCSYGGETTTEIEPFAFSGDFASVLVIPGTVTEIGEQAFANCENLGLIHFFSNTPPEFGEDVFLNSGTNRTRNIVVGVPPGALPAYKAVEQLKGFYFYQRYMNMGVHCNDCLKIICECEY